MVALCLNWHRGVHQTGEIYKTSTNKDMKDINKKKNNKDMQDVKQSQFTDDNMVWKQDFCSNKSNGFGQESFFLELFGQFKLNHAVKPTIEQFKLNDPLKPKFDQFRCFKTSSLVFSMEKDEKVLFSFSYFLFWTSLKLNMGTATKPYLSCCPQYKSN